MREIDRLKETAARQDCVIYNVLNRRAGWAIEWHEQEREDNPTRPGLTHAGKDSWKNGLVVYCYYDTFDEMLAGELERLSEQESVKV